MRDQTLVTVRTGSSGMTWPWAVEADAAIDADANRGVGGKPDPAHQGEQFLPCADPGAAIAQVARGAPEHGDIPAGASQQMGGEQAADRAADH